MKRKLVLLFACLLVAGTMSAQKRVTGRVTDANGTPLAEAAVRVAGTKIVTYTDANGNFTLSEVPDNAKQVAVSLLGYGTQQAAISGTMSIVLQESETALEEAVVVGYGTARKLGTVVGTVTKVGSEKIENKPVTTALDALQGKVAGVQIYNNTGDVGSVSGTSTTVRGVGSLNGGNAPLYVVDGQPVDASVFYMMNQNDIESYTVLRDASSTSIYGARAANGVIVVTTKKGRRGEKAVVKVGQSIGWSMLARRVGDPMTSSELLDYYLANGVLSGGEYSAYKASGINTDWQKYYFKDSAPMYNTNLSIAGGSENTQYYVSGAYMKKTALTPESKFKRFNVRVNLETKPLDWMRFGINLGLNYDERNNDTMIKDLYTGNNPVMSTVMNLPWINPYDANGDKLPTIPIIGTYTNEIWAKYNPVWYNDARLTGSAFIELTPVRGLTLKSLLGADMIDTRGSSQYRPDHPRLISQKNFAGGNVSERFSRSADWTITNTAEYNWQINDDHQLIFLLGQEGLKATDHAFSAKTTGHSDSRLMELGHGTDVAIADIGLFGHNKVEYLSFFGRVDYTLMQRYFANITVRNDRSSRFGSENRSATFASGGVAWDAKSEKFLKNTWWLDQLKLNFNVGSTGNSQGIGYYESLGTVGTTLYGGAQGWGLSAPGNNQLGWETQIQTTFGISGRIFNRANIDLSFYKRKTKDMLMSVPVPYTTGFSEQTLNIGSMSNTGIEIQFDVDAVKNWHGLDVNIYGNFTYNKNQIDELFYGKQRHMLPNYLIAYVVGESVNYYMPVRKGINPDNGNIVWYVPDEDGNLTDETTESYSDRLYANTGKKRYAPINGGFGVNATWKGFTLNADFSYVLGKWMIDNLDYFTLNSRETGSNQDRRMLNSWKQPGDITDVPRFGVQNQFDTSLLHNSSFCRLKNLSLSYDLPGKWMDATGFIKNVRLTASGRNLLTITKWKGADPEFNSNLTAASAIPNSREYTLGVEVTF